jgi:hypothetical protein
MRGVRAVLATSRIREKLGKPSTSDVPRGIAPGARSWLAADVPRTKSSTQRDSAGVVAGIGRASGSPA